MASLKVSRIGGTSPVANPAFKLSRIGGDGVTVASSALKLSRLAGDGPLAIRLDPLTAQVIDPAVTYIVLLQAVLTGGGVADGYTWRQVSGTAVTLDPADERCAFVTPSVMPPANATVVIGVTATVAGVTSPERQVTITVFPQLDWVFNDSRQWVGQQPEVAL